GAKKFPAPKAPRGPPAGTRPTFAERPRTERGSPGGPQLGGGAGGTQPPPQGVRGTRLRDHPAQARASKGAASDPGTGRLPRRDRTRSAAQQTGTQVLSSPQRRSASQAVANPAGSACSRELDGDGQH